MAFKPHHCMAYLLPPSSTSSLFITNPEKMLTNVYKVYKVEKSSQKNGFCLSRRSQRRIKRASHDKDIDFYELKITSNFQKTNMTRTRNII